MESGLTVGMWMAAAALLGIWMWRNGALRRLGPLPVRLSLGALFLTTVFCKSFGALALLAAGLAMLWAVRSFRTAIPVALLIAVTPLYLGFRLSGAWSGEDLAAAAGQTGGEERADSLRFRLKNDEILMAKAMDKKWTGWGRWGRSRIHDADGRDVSVTDGLWIITLGQFGLVGLVALTMSLLLPAILVLRRYPTRLWRQPLIAPAAGLSVILVLFMIDNLFNAMPNPLFFLAAGALTSACTQRVRSLDRTHRTPASPRGQPTLAAPILVRRSARA
jgi:hypothetical protein